MAASFQAWSLVQVCGRSAIFWPLCASKSVAAAQSNWTSSGQETWYQKERVPPAAGTLNCCESELSAPGAFAPTWAEAAPLWPTALCDTEPAAVQPVRPLSNPPLTRAGAGGAPPVMATSSYNV